MRIKFAVKEFIDDRKLMNLSKHTISGYTVQFNDFEKFCIERREKENIEEITTGDVKSFLLRCQEERNNNPVSINTKIKNLKALFNFLVQEDIISGSRNPMDNVKKQKTDTKIDVFTEEHIKQMLSYYRRLKGRDKNFWAVRDYTIIMVLLGSGMRLGELCNIKWSNVNFKTNTLILYGKNRRQESVPLHEEMRKELLSYREYCIKEFGELSQFVFVTRENTPLTSNGVKMIFKRLKEVMNFKDVRLSAHTFRHTFAHEYLMNGGDVFSLQRMLRHSSLKMTEKYLALWGNALKEQNDKFNPLNNI